MESCVPLECSIFVYPVKNQRTLFILQRDFFIGSYDSIVEALQHLQYTSTQHTHIDPCCSHSLLSQTHVVIENYPFKLKKTRY